MKLAVFKFLSALMKVFPRVSNKDLNNLSGFQKAITGMRIWVTSNLLEEQSQTDPQAGQKQLDKIFEDQGH